MFSRIHILVLALVLSFSAYAQDKNTFTVGTDYQTVTPAATYVPVKNKVTVIEFFNYGCPACYRFEPVLEKWLKNKPDYVDFKRVPLVFHSEWENYAKAYYVAESLNIAEKISPDMFDAINKPELAKKYNGLKTVADLQKFFVDHGVNQKDFDNAFSYSVVIDSKMKNGAALMQAYQVYGIPTLIINGKYKTGLENTNGDHDKVIKILSFLVEKSHKES